MLYEVITDDLSAKTLEAWIMCDDLDQRGGAAISSAGAGGPWVPPRASAMDSSTRAVPPGSSIMAAATSQSYNFV